MLAIARQPEKKTPAGFTDTMRDFLPKSGVKSVNRRRTSRAIAAWARGKEIDAEKGREVFALRRLYIVIVINFLKEINHDSRTIKHQIELNKENNFWRKWISHC